MKFSKGGIDLLKRLEGFSNCAYKCSAGRYTIGFGFTKGVCQGDMITKEDAEKRLKLTLIGFEQCINEFVHRDLTQNQFDALVLFVYNVGIGAFKGSTLLKLLNVGASPIECAQQFLKWDKITVDGEKKVSTGLANRRKAEKELFLTKEK